MHQNINLLLPKLDHSQECYMNLWQAEQTANAKTHITVFCKEIQAAPIKPTVGIFALDRGLYSPGLTIANGMEMARYLSSCISEKKVIYLWEIDWVFENQDYFANFNLLNSYPVICGSSFYAKAIENYAGVKPILSDFSLEAINEICNR